MRKDYEPNRKGIVGEMYRRAKGKFSKKNVLRIGSGLKDFGFVFGGIGTIVASCPYYVPTAVRKIMDADGCEEDTLGENLGFWTGIIGGILVDIGQFIGYSYLARNGYPEILVVPVATNVVSGVYELGRASYRNAKEKLIEKYQRKLPDGLGSVVESESCVGKSDKIVADYMI